MLSLLLCALWVASASNCPSSATSVQLLHPRRAKYIRDLLLLQCIFNTTTDWLHHCAQRFITLSRTSPNCQPCRLFFPSNACNTEWLTPYLLSYNNHLIRLKNAVFFNNMNNKESMFDGKNCIKDPHTYA